nr:site-specific integrase [Pseudomonadota bacterium]
VPADPISRALPDRGMSRYHYAALPWQQVGSFMEALAGEGGVAALALRFAILTAARSGEARGATWAEIDLGTATWSIPGARMKANREHRVPLSDAALAVLREAAALRDASGLVFPGAKPGRPLSDVGLSGVLRRMKRDDLTVHGFRSTFRDWCAEATGYPRELAEAALAHVLTNKVEAAYQRGDLFEKRARLMAEWGTFCGRVAPAGGDVVPLRKPEAA